MTRRCPNCDQLLLEDELVCWQCGFRQDAEAADAAALYPAPAAQSTDQRLIVYGVLTACVAIAVLLLTSFLGRQPRGQAALPEGWAPVTDQSKSFSLFVPIGWQVAEGDAARTTLAQILAESDNPGRLLEPLAAFVEDEEIVFLASSERATTFIVIARSAILNRLTPSEAVTLLDADSSPSLEAGVIWVNGVPQASIRIDTDNVTGATLTCHQRFLQGREVAMLFSLCGLQPQLSAETRETILSSIQLTQ